MRPLVLLGEACEEAGRRDAPRWPPANVRYIGEWALDLLIVVVPQRHAPGAVPRVLTGVEQLLSERVVVAVEARCDVAQCDDASAREGGDVDHRIGFEALRIGERVAQNQAALGVGV